MKRLLLVLVIAIQLMADCPFMLDKCEYHNFYSVPKVRTEFRNGKEFGVYEHAYYDGGKRRVCRLILECKR